MQPELRDDHRRAATNRHPMILAAAGNTSTLPLLSSMPDDQSNKARYDELVELAKMCAHQARVTMAKDVADELRRMAREYQQRAADLNSGKMPDIGQVGDE
jgi:hypothetical protein